MKRLWKNGLLLVVAAFLPVFFTLLMVKPQTAAAVNPTTMSFQGKVVNADGTNVTDGTYTFLFKLYTASSGGTAVWTETQSSVTVAGGVFQVNLGSSCSFFTAATCNNNTPIDFTSSSSLYLGITFNNDAAGEMTPRVQMQSVPFAFNADNASKVGGLSVSQLVQLSPGTQQAGFISINGAGTFGGTLNATSATTGVALTGGVAATATSSLLQLGSAIVNGNVATNGGTYIGINAPSSGAGSAADFLHFELSGTTKLSVANTGAITSASTIAGTQVNGTTGLYTGAGLGTQRIDASGNVSALKATVSSNDIALWLLSTPAATAGAHALLQVGVGFTNANTATNGGTYIGLNAAATGLGSAADFLNFQVGGSSKLKIDNTGTITSSGSLSNVTTTSSTSVITPSLASSGALSISSGGANNVTIDTGATGGAITIGGTNAASVAISRSGQTTTVNGALSVTQNASFNNNVTMNFTGTQGLAITSDQVGSSNGISFIATPSSTAGTTNGLFVQQAASSNSHGLDDALKVDNANTSMAITNGLEFANSGGGGYTNLIQSANFSVSGSGNGTFAGTIGVTGTATLAGGATVSAFGGGTWINLPTSGPSAIGTGGAGSNPFIGYAAGAGNYFTNAAAGDVAYRNTSGNLLFGNTSGNSQVVMSTASTLFQTTGLVALLTVDNTNSKVQIGSATSDATQVNLQLDSSNVFADSGTCGTATNQGAMYYNTSSASMRACINGNWEDLASTGGLGILAYGVIADTGANPGDISSHASTTAGTGPCKVSWASASSVTVTACAVYTGGRKVVYAGGTFSGLSTTNGNWTHLCFAAATTPFAPGGTLNALTATATETANLPQWSASMPSVCLADIKGTGANINIYDTRVFTNTLKTFVNTAVAMGIGWMARDNAATSVGTVTTTTATVQANLKGVIVASGATACTSACGPNAVMAYSGPVYVKSIAGALALGSYVGTSGTTSYGVVATGATNLSPYQALGIGETTFTNTCSSAVNCNLSMLTNVDIR